MGSGATKGQKEVKEEKEEKVDGYNVVCEVKKEETHVTYNLFGLKSSEKKTIETRTENVPASLHSPSSFLTGAPPKNALKY